MLERLAYMQYANKNRPKHISTMKAEWKLAKEKGIAIKAVWHFTIMVVGLVNQKIN